MFTEQNSVEYFVIKELTGVDLPYPTTARETTAEYFTQTATWKYVPAAQLPRKTSDILVEPILADALLRLNPSMQGHPDRAEEVMHKLRGILLMVQHLDLVRANEQFSAWLLGEKTMPYGVNHQHVPIRLIDFDTLSNNSFIVTNQYTVTTNLEKIPDLVLLVNGLPLVVGEFKTPTRPAISWLDGAVDIHDDYEQTIPALFAPNVFSFATEGKYFRYGSIRMPLELWGPWREDRIEKGGETTAEILTAVGLQEVSQALHAMLKPAVILDILQHFAIFATDKQNRKIKIIGRYQQYEGANRLVQLVIEGRINRGLIWHFQGSGKSLLMVFAAQKLRSSVALDNPTILIVVDRTDLDTQITATFNATDIPNIVTTDNREELQRLLQEDSRKIIITMIHKFGEVTGVLNDRKNIIVLVDEAHRTQEGDLGRKMRNALPNAFLFGLTGTPINRRDRNTFYAFGAEQDHSGYLSRYSFQQSIKDKATLQAQECLDTNEKRDAFATDFSYLERHWEAISPDPFLNPYEHEYKWLSNIYQSVRPTNETGRLIWHAFGAKTLQLMHKHIHVEHVHDDLETVVVNADVLEEFIKNKDPQKVKEIEIEITKRIARHQNALQFIALSERLQKLKEQAEQGVINSIEFLKYLIKIAEDLLKAEKEETTKDEQKTAKAALTELFKEVKTAHTPKIVENIVNDLDEIVRIVRFEGWQNTTKGQREVKQALRKTLFNYKLHNDQELFERAYKYIEQYY